LKRAQCVALRETYFRQVVEPAFFHAQLRHGVRSLLSGKLLMFRTFSFEQTLHSLMFFVR
jgi:hypothetical protein